MRPIWRSVTIIFHTGLAFILAAIVTIVTDSPYEFMMAEQENSKFCNLPTPSDDHSDVFAPITLILAIGLKALAVRYARKRRRLDPVLIPAGLVLLWWGYRFFLRGLAC